MVEGHSAPCGGGHTLSIIVIDYILFYIRVTFIRGFKSGVSVVTSVLAAGYYYELDDSYDESDEEEVRAHLRRVSEQPPLKLDDSTEVKHLLTHTLPVLSMTKHCATIFFFASPHRNWTSWERLA